MISLLRCLPLHAILMFLLGTSHCWVRSDDPSRPLGPADFASMLDAAQMKLVKIYGAGGLKGLESYQSGFFISDQGHVLTSWSTVLDIDKIRIVTHDGKKWEGELIGSDPVTELAIVKIEGDGFPFFRLNPNQKAEVGDRIFGLSNLFGIAAGEELQSIQRGVIMASTTLASRRGRMKTPYQGPIYVIDAMTNNPGATGGALITLRGELLGILGKELRDEGSGIWLNYAIPVDVVAESSRNILEGKTIKKPAEVVVAKRPHRLIDLGLTLVPNVLPKTPAYVDQVAIDSIAARSGLKPNDLVIAINGQRVDSRKALEELISTIDRADPVALLIQRGNELVSIEIRP